MFALAAITTLAIQPSLILIIPGGVVALIVIFLLMGVRYVPNNRVGLIEKRFAARGSVESGLIAMNGEAGFQPGVLRGGLHWLMPIQYIVHRVHLVTIPQGKIGYVFARDGKTLEPTQSLGSNQRAVNFEDVRMFLAGGGQRGIRPAGRPVLCTLYSVLVPDPVTRGATA